MDFKSVREKYPQYDDLSDEDLARALHKKYYNDIAYEDFAGKVGLTAAPTVTPTAPEKEKPGVFRSMVEGAGQGATAGWGDEILAGAINLGQKAGLVGPTQGSLQQGEGQPSSYDQLRDIARDQTKEAKEAHPVAFGVGKVGGALIPASKAFKGVSTIGQAAKAGGALGAVQGLGEGEGDAVDQALSTGVGAGAGALGGVVGQAAAPYIAKSIEKVGETIIGGGARQLQEIAGKMDTKVVKDVADRALRIIENQRQSAASGGKGYIENLPLEAKQRIYKIVKDTADDLAAKGEQFNYRALADAVAKRLNKEDIGMPGVFGTLVTEPLKAAGGFIKDVASGNIKNVLQRGGLAAGASLAHPAAGVAVAYGQSVAKDIGARTAARVTDFLSRNTHKLEESLLGGVSGQTGPMADAGANAARNMVQQGASWAAIDNVLKQTNPSYRNQPEEDVPESDTAPYRAP